MRFDWRGYSMFGAGLLLGSLATGVLFAPPDPANQPPPWEHLAQDQARAAAATHVAGAGPARPVLAVAVQPAVAASAAAPQPLAMASQPLAVASQPAGTQVPAAVPTAAAVPPAAVATTPQPAAAPKAQTVAKSESGPKPQRKRKRVTRHADEESATDFASPPAAASDPDVAVDTLHLPPQRASRGDTLSGPPETAPVTRPAENHDDSAPASSGDAGSSDATQ